MSAVTVTSSEIAVMAGRPNDRCFASNRTRNDASFPRPVALGKRGCGKDQKSRWLKSEVEAWLAQRAQPELPKSARPAGVRLHSLDLTLALQFICAPRLTTAGLGATRHIRLALNESRKGKEVTW